MAAGQRPINNVVDITNYVMLLTGQPLHAFDWDLVAGGQLVVRARERRREDDDARRRRAHARPPTCCLICDDDGPTSIAGVMGGQRSEVQPTTTRVLMEAANWNGPNLQRTSQRLGLRTEASGRFEKGLAPEQRDVGPGRLDPADARADAARGWSPARSTSAAQGPPPKTLRLRDEKVTRLLGTEVPLGEQAELLERLEFGVADGGDGLDVTVPPFRRNDVTREVDLIEEVARLWGLEKLPATIPGARLERAADAPSRSCAAARATRSSARASPRRSAGASSRPRSSASCGSTCPPCGCATRCPRTCRRCARRCSARC